MNTLAGSADPADLLQHLVGGFSGEHGDLRKAIEDVQRLVEAGSYVTAAKQWGAFRIREERHIAWEEALLGELEERFGLRGAISTARRAHRLLKQRLNEAAAALSAWDPERFRLTLESMLPELEAHWRHETRVLLPEFRLLLSDPDIRQQIEMRLTGA